MQVKLEETTDHEALLQARYRVQAESVTTKADSTLSAVLNAIEDKVASTKSKNGKGSGGKQAAPYTQILLTFADGLDKTYLFIGYFAAALAGAALPTFTFMFGDIVNGIGTDDDQGVIEQSKRMLYIGCGVFFAAWWYVAFLSILADRIAQKTKVQYLRSILRQEIAWFDANNVQELSSKLSKDCAAIQRACGEKAGFMMFSAA